MSGVNYLLIAVLIAAVIGVIKGYKKGFLRIAVYLAGLIVVVLIVTKISPYVSNFMIDHTSMYETVRQKVINVYAEQNSAVDNTVVENQNATIESYGLPSLIAGALISNNNEEMYSRLAASLFEEYISGFLAKLIIKAGSFVGLFLIFAILMFICLTAIKIIEKIPVLRTFNRVLGMAAGLSMVLIFVWVFFLAVMIFFGNSLGEWMLSQIKNSSILSFLFNNNLLFQILINS